MLITSLEELTYVNLTSEIITNLVPGQRCLYNVMAPPTILAQMI